SCCAIFLTLYLSGTALAAPCASVRPFEDAHAKSSKGESLTLVPFTGAPDVSAVVTILMKEYLSLAKGLTRVTLSGAGASRSESRPILRGEVERNGQGYAFVFTLEKASGEVLKVEGKSLYPERLNDALVAAVDQISKALKNPLPPKKLLPF